MRKQSSSFNTNRVLPVSCSNFHSIELQARELSIWCQHLLYLGRFFFDSGVGSGEAMTRRQERRKNFTWMKRWKNVFFFICFLLPQPFPSVEKIEFVELSSLNLSPYDRFVREFNQKFNEQCSPSDMLLKLNLIEGSKSADGFIMPADNCCCCCCCCWLIIRLLFGLLLLALASTNAFGPIGLSSGLARFRRMLLLPLLALTALTTLVCWVRPLTTALSPCRTIWEEFRPLLDPPAKRVSESIF